MGHHCDPTRPNIPTAFFAEGVIRQRGECAILMYPFNPSLTNCHLVQKGCWWQSCNCLIVSQESCPCQEMAKSVALIHVALRASQGHSGGIGIKSQTREPRGIGSGVGEYGHPISTAGTLISMVW
jgi:hypothetical protein